MIYSDLGVYTGERLGTPATISSFPGIENLE